MKKANIVITIILLIILTFSLPVISHAENSDENNEGNILYGNAEAVEIFEGDSLVLECLSYRDIFYEDIELEKINRQYCDPNNSLSKIIFKKNIQSADEMEEVLKQLECFYSFPVYKNDNSYDIWADIWCHEDSKYKWDVSAFGELDPNEIDRHQVDYTEKMEKFFEYYDIEESVTFFLRWLSSNSLVTAVCFPQDGSGDGPYYVEMDMLPSNASSIEDIEPAVFSYDEIKECEYVLPRGVSYWPLILMFYIVIAIIVAAIVVLIVVICKKAAKKKKEKDENESIGE